MHLWMQRFHAPTEHLRPAGEIGDIANGHLRIAQQLGGAAGGKNLDSQRRQAFRKLHDPGLVENADQRTCDCHVKPPRTKKHNSVSGVQRKWQKVEAVLVENTGSKANEAKFSS